MHIQLRQRCRNPKCSVKLRPPVTSRRDAFCSRGCFDSYYRKHCLVCEAPIARLTERNLFCGRQKCRNEWRRNRERFASARSLASGLATNTSRNSIKSGTKIASQSDRGWRVVAGPDVPVLNLVVPLDPELVGRLARKHADFNKYWRKANWHAARKALIKRYHPPANLLGGYKFPNAPTVDLSPIEPAPASWAVQSRWAPVGGADLPDIPDFLNRVPAAPRPVGKAAA
jgi:hypothetical protein